METIRTNSPKAWLLAARPKTLTGALVPVMIALSLAWHDDRESFQWLPALLCLLFACMMQIDANFVNDYFDYKRGIDREDRLGPERACSQGWITTAAMKRALILVTCLSALLGLPLIAWGGWNMIWIGIACILFCFLYTTFLSSRAMGDVLVLVFFGWVPVCATYYLQSGQVTTDCFLLATGCGLAIDNLLVVNNFRDRDTDRLHGKITLVTLLGEKPSLALYLLLGIVAYVLLLITTSGGGYPSFILPSLYIAAVIGCWQLMRRIRSGRALNSVLGKTSLTILLYGIAACINLLFLI